MTRQILVLNAGSSSIKYKLFPIICNQLHSPIVSGIAELSDANNPNGSIYHQNDKEKATPHIFHETKLHLPTIHQALSKISDLLCAPKIGGISSFSDLVGVGHRVVHGGEQCRQAKEITSSVKTTIKDASKLAPLHNPGNLQGIQVAEKVFGNVRQVAVFDTAFHSTIPNYAYLYALPYELYQSEHIRRYGFHGTSHEFCLSRVATHFKKKLKEMNLITCHLGNGASITAIKNGKSIDTSMGFTPLEGLIMGTRSGDIDPAIQSYLMKNKGMSVDQVDTLLNKKSGLLGICKDKDMRHIHERELAGDKQAQLAIQMVVYRIRKYIGAYLLEIGDLLDAIVFTGGIGENASYVREQILSNLEFVGIRLDHQKNKKEQGLNIPKGEVMPPVEIQQVNSKVKIMIVHADEERCIAQQTLHVLQ